MQIFFLVSNDRYSLNYYNLTIISASCNAIMTMDKVWIDRKIEGNTEGTAAGLLDECILDDDEGKCERFSSSLAKLDGLLGVGAGEQF